MPRGLVFLGSLVSLALWSGAATAHAVGLSKGEYVVEGRTVMATLILARAELGDPSEDSGASIGAAVVKATRVEGDGEPCAGSLDSVTVDQQDGLVVRSRYRCKATPSGVRVHAGFVDQLPPG